MEQLKEKREQHMSLKDDIRKLYRENPHLSGEQIRERLGHKNDRHFWKALNSVQVTLRGGPTIAKSKSGHRFNLRPKGNVYFIPPKSEDAV